MLTTTAVGAPIIATALLLSSLGCSQPPQPPAAAERMPPLTGRWIRVYPASMQPPDTVEIRSDGTASGRWTDNDSSVHIVSGWRIGTHPAEGMLCLTAIGCFGYRIDAGDTLVVANTVDNTVLIRVAGAGRAGRPDSMAKPVLERPVRRLGAPPLGQGTGTP